jgi:signal transduction histidine kinase/CheY-like chemotaxis protein
MCIGRSPEDALDIAMEALPTALSCDLVYLSLPGSPPRERAVLAGSPLQDDQLAAVRGAIARDATGMADVPLPGIGKVWCLKAEVPIGSDRGQLCAGRRAPFDVATDRVLVRTAANVLGTLLQTATVLEAARRKDEFLAILGHELRNPLAPIATAVELLARQPAVAREQRVIERHTRHLARLVDDLLDISRVTRGFIDLRDEPVTLASVLERAVEMVAPLVSRHRHALHVGDAGDAVLQGDPVRLAQVFGNLLTNAAKFTPPRGTISVAIERLPGRVRVAVCDDGVGIERTQLSRIFEPFVQANRERDAPHGGLGLGLAIVQRLVEGHGGTITVKSAGAGRGSTFTVDLPIAARVAHPPPAPAAEVVVPAREQVRVLIVDDNVDLAEMLSAALQIEGFDTAVEHDALGALSRWRTFAPHAAVLDVGLPDLDGYELAKTLRAEHGTDPTLIAATGYGQQRDRLLAVDAGFDLHMVKPVSVQDLVSVLDQRVVAPSLDRLSPDLR